jgi:glycosyltransferase involved in cell wall biosynthesis
MTKISVVISTYKSEKFMTECLEELIKQTIFEHLEIMIVDAASPQQEKDIVNSYQKKYDNIFYLRLNKRIGIYPAWNIGIKKTKAPYITAFSTNDRLNPVAYETLSKALDENPDVDLVYGDTFLSPIPHTPFESGRDIPGLTFKWPDYSYRYLLANNCIGPHPMWRRRVHAHVGYFDEQYIALGDQEFWLRLGRKFRMLHLPFFSGLFWWTPNSLSGDDSVSEKEFIEIRKKYMQIFAQDCTLFNQILDSIRLLNEEGRTEKAKILLKQCGDDYFFLAE